MTFTNAEGNRCKDSVVASGAANSPPKNTHTHKVGKKRARRALLEKQAGILEDVRTIRKTVARTAEFMDSVEGSILRVVDMIKFNEGDELGTALASRLEGLFILIWGLNTCTSTHDMVPHILQYVNTWSGSKTLTSLAIKLVKSLLTEDMNDVEDQGLRAEAGWIEQKWEALVKGTFGQRIASVLTVLVTAGFLPEKHEKGFTAELFNALNVTALRKKSASMTEHILKLLDWSYECVYPALITGDYSLLLGKDEISDADAMYRSVINAVGLHATGQMKECKEKHGIGNEAELLVFMNTVAHVLEGIKRNCKKDMNLQNNIVRKLIHLDKLMTDLQATWHESSLREKPFAILIRGKSSVGKSTVASIVEHVILFTNEFPEGKEYTVTLNGSDEFQSEFRTQHISVRFDDMCNTRPEREKSNPLFILIQFINNMHCSALSPEADRKGKNDIRCKLVICTTNTRDLHAAYFSIEPASIMRRFDLILDVELKEECATKDGGIHPRYAGQTQPDIWKFTINRVVITRNNDANKPDRWDAVPVDPDNPQTDLVGLIDYLASVTPEYYATQKKIVESNTELHKREHCDKHPLMILPCLKCMKDRPSDIVCDDLYTLRDVDVKDEASAFISCTESESEGLETQAGLLDSKDVDLGDASAALEAEKLDQSRLDFYIPVDENEDIQECELSCLDRIKNIIAQKMEPMADLWDKKRALVQNTSGWLRCMATISAVAGATYATYKYFRPSDSFESQGAIISRISAAAKSPDTIADRDNKYKKVYSNIINYPTPSMTTTLSQLESKIDRNLYCVFITELDGNGQAIGNMAWANAVPIGGTEWLVNGHLFKQNTDYKVEFRCHPGAGIKTWTMIVNEANTRPIFGTDAVAIEAPQGGDNADFTKWMFGNEQLMTDANIGSTVMLYHVHKDVVLGKLGYVTPSAYKVACEVIGFEEIDVPTVGKYKAVTYKAETHKGMCGSLVFTAGPNPVFLGIHSAGDPSKGKGVAAIITKEAISASKVADEIQVTEADPENLVTQLGGYGVEVKVHDEVHPHSPLHFLPDDQEYNFEVIGQHNLPTARFKSDVKKSIISDAVCEQVGIDPKHGAPPKSGVSKSRREHLINCSKNRPPMNPRYLKMAEKDFKAKLVQTVLSKAKTVKEFVHPLDMDTVMSGSPGKKGYDPLNVNSSMGHPLNKQKWRFLMNSTIDDIFGIEHKKLVTLKEINGKKEYVYEVKFDPEKADVEAEIEKGYSRLLDGQRVYYVFRTCLKDEAIKFEKIADGKIRIFASAPVELVCSSRQITLTLINLMTYFPIEFESAVGVDATGKDWQYLYEQLSEFGDHFGDGDYSKFDQSLTPEIMKSAFNVARFVFDVLGYEAEWLKLFDGIATEIMYPVYEVDGVFVKIIGSMPSGHPWTVQLNGFCNSLYMRYCYYAKMDEKTTTRLTFGEVPLFHTQVMLLTYGDDHIFAVKDGEYQIGMMDIYQVLTSIGLGYTEADKKAPQRQYKDKTEIDFLKRGFVYHPTLKAHVGPLSEDSIYKSLLMTKKRPKGSNESEAEIAAGVMAQALVEFYYHSPEKYRYHVPIFQKIADSTKDGMGFRVKDYYRPPSEDEIIARYEATTCCYHQAKVTIGLEKQIGYVDDEEPVYTPILPRTLQGVYEYLERYHQKLDASEILGILLLYNMRESA